MTTALLIGGPADGRMMQVSSGHYRESIRVPMLQTSAASWLAAAETSPTECVAYDVAEYVYEKIDPGSGLVIYVYEPEAIRHRHRTQTVPGGRWRWCRACDVKWWGDDPCWYCGEPEPQPGPPPVLT